MVPELPQWSRAEGERNRPLPRMVRPRPGRSGDTSAPSARRHAADERASSEVSAPSIRLSPGASAARTRARWVMDLSPGTRMGAGHIRGKIVPGARDPRIERGPGSRTSRSIFRPMGNPLTLGHGPDDLHLHRAAPRGTGQRGARRPERRGLAECRIGRRQRSRAPDTQVPDHDRVTPCGGPRHQAAGKLLVAALTAHAIAGGWRRALAAGSPVASPGQWTSGRIRGRPPGPPRAEGCPIDVGERTWESIR